MDSSGSMTGQRNEIAKATVMKILDTLNDDDFFNVIRVSFNTMFSLFININSNKYKNLWYLISEY